jgi:hypothetical protein
MPPLSLTVPQVEEASKSAYFHEDLIAAVSREDGVRRIKWSFKEEGSEREYYWEVTTALPPPLLSPAGLLQTHSLPHRRPLCCNRLALLLPGDHREHARCGPSRLCLFPRCPQCELIQPRGSHFRSCDSLLHRLCRHGWSLPPLPLSTNHPPLLPAMGSGQFSR